MEKLFLFSAMMCLLLVSCQYPDDDVDMPEPEPEKPVSERILGTWINTRTTFIELNSTGKPLNKFIHDHPYSYPRGYFYSIDSNYVTTFYSLDNQDEMQESVGYTLTESKGKTYIGEETFIGTTVYEITILTDSTMKWVMNDSLAALSDAYDKGSYPDGVNLIEDFIKYKR
ncbi:hypothetical protein I2I11_05825 [Pontibacter sp. 172403-2]|uniref:hypothetical protein n=1 Tax=Pontibacter rufus TaxID=2791028 RepID=UPI0018AFA5A3|nr:hypothetical protein [Pontibacter sp. 172403-2]MBF9252799.1 hypothetical protein [Pontibacter sp. 172403-2]